MRPILILALVLLLPAGIASAEEKAICAVCGPREGAGFETVKATAVYQGKHYSFCSLSCKVAFLKNPSEFLASPEGVAAPPFHLHDLAGQARGLDDYRGDVILLDFWATFCPPCLKALPELEALQQRYGSRGLRVIGVSIDEKEELVRKAVARAGVTYPILKGTAAVWNAYKVNALPTLVLVGRDGRIIRRFGGEADPQLMIKTIEQALAR